MAEWQNCQFNIIDVLTFALLSLLFPRFKTFYCSSAFHVARDYL